MEDSGGKFVFGALMALLSLVGLFMASRADDEAFYWTGLAVFLFGVLIIFGLIGRSGREPGSAGEHGEEEERPSP